MYKPGTHPNSRKRRQYNCNDNFFSEVSQLTSYWAGFLAADGFIRDQSENNIQLGCMLAGKDKHHLERLRDDLDSTKPLWEGESNGFPSCSLTIASKKLCADLEINFNITPRKSMTYNPPALSEDYIDSFIVGYIDGDGCICTSQGLYVSALGTEQMTKFIYDRASILIGKSCGNVYSKGNQYNFMCTNSDARALYQRLYDLPVPKLERKWTKEIKDYCDNYVHPHTKITDDMIPAIRIMSESGMSQRAIAEVYGVHQMTISRILRK